ncbi:disease resistance RPP13-like protein 4 [Cryptomeria japonica]|uniref:disease resistance RPP13-like protein 4 n=1 Tax=Cryptomeria japonica TaxID=3369 RepID=UPI0027D9DEEA|nr:disease resistance RPP13-like protein 4 [Cryptomeria japonica]
MASVIGEALLGKVCEIVLEITLRKLPEEANTVVNFRKEFRWLNKKLRHVRGFLKDADQQSRHNEDVKEWLEEIRVISMLAEDICEECAVEPLYVNNVQSCGLSFNKCIFRYRTGRRIKDIKDRIRSVIEEGNELKLLHDLFPANEASPSSSTSQSVDWKRSSVLPSGSDSHTVGIESKVDDLLKLLDSNAFPVIAVVGMGGMGKTHLLQHVYNHSNIKERYEKSIWLSVSQSYSISKLQKDLVFQINDEELSKRVKESEVSEQVLAPEIHKKLKGKRCLVVLDDVWRASREDDLLARLGLPTANNIPCKIVVTTRSREVCANLNANIYEMQNLSDEDSWRLFCVYAFEGSEIKREPEKHLVEVGRKIVKQCGNLPLAIKTIAASLAKTRLPREWESKLQQLQGLQTPNVDPIMSILRLSYDSLPAVLKACFAYLSFFPEDQVIHCEYLINLWIGEGFIPAGEGQWDAAWDCLYQLASLCLLQLWEQVQLDETILQHTLIKQCKIHDLLLDLAIQVSRENKCIFSIEEASKDASADWCRILLVKKDIHEEDISDSRPVCLRTFSLSHNRGIGSIPPTLFTAMRGLRVLDLSGTGISALPESIGKMKLLKVLNLKDTYIREVSECVRHLKSLLFLALPQGCYNLPLWINEVKCLQHLECENVSRMPKGISELVSLRRLRSSPLYLSIEEDELMKSEDFADMAQLQELRLNVGYEMDLEGIVASLVKMRWLYIANMAGTEELVVPEKVAAMKDLESLTLGCFEVPNLRELELHWYGYSDSLEFQIMPNLVRLTLYGENRRCRGIAKAFGKADGFPQLRFLKISWFDEIEEFPELEEGAMACLEELKLTRCPKVKKVGGGLEHLKRLKLFNYRGTGTDELRKMFKEGGEYCHKIKSINPHVTIKG